MQLVVLLRDFKCETLHIHVEKVPPEAFSDGLMRNQLASYWLKLKLASFFSELRWYWWDSWVFEGRWIFWFKNPAPRSLFFLLLFFQRRQKCNIGCSAFRCCWTFFVEPAFKRYFPLPSIWGIIWFLRKIHPNAAPFFSVFVSFSLLCVNFLPFPGSWAGMETGHSVMAT